MTWQDWAGAEAREIRAAGQMARAGDLDRNGPINFASNDYLGLTRHPAVIAAAHAALDEYGSGSGSARLIVGSRPVHSELERELARVEGDAPGGAVPHRFRDEPRRDHDVRRRRRARVLRRAQPRVDHRRLPPRPW